MSLRERESWKTESLRERRRDAQKKIEREGERRERLKERPRFLLLVVFYFESNR